MEDFPEAINVILSIDDLGVYIGVREISTKAQRHVDTSNSLCNEMEICWVNHNKIANFVVFLQGDERYFSNNQFTFLNQSSFDFRGPRKTEFQKPQVQNLNRHKTT